ncbi:MAG: N-acetylmuramoyl-L-alanine amidase [Burkholderiales bacterium]|nr:N-acetylmuramoyl-L-alanine amidase [Burkholderiales bacterium]
MTNPKSSSLVFSHRRRLLIGLALAATPYPSMAQTLLSASPSPSSARFWSSAEYSRLVIETPERLPYRFFTLTAPNRLVFDFDRRDMVQELIALSRQIEETHDPYIASLRLGDREQGKLRLVLDVKDAVDPQVFELSPVANFGYRLILDVYPKLLFDPLLWLVREFEEQNNVAALESKYADDESLLKLVHEYEQRAKPVGAPSQSAPQSTTKTPSSPSSPTTPDPSAPEKAGQGKKPARAIIVMIDPGHGGEDPGAIGKRGTMEKNVVLAIGKHLKKIIDAVPNMRAALTRDGDYFVPLNQRVEKARRIKADLMVSIHADAFSQPTASGSSVFALSEKGATSSAARWLAQKENEADLVGGINIKKGKDMLLAKTLLDLSQAAQIKSSLDVGALILKALARHNALHRGVVEQASFAVLKAPDIPSILVETAFISNPQEEEKLRTATHQQRFAESIAEGIFRFFKV